jgi:DNA-binding XRE family transcriptional regulator
MLPSQAMGFQADCGATLGDLLKEWRIAAGITLTQAAKRCRISRELWFQLEQERPSACRESREVTLGGSGRRGQTNEGYRDEVQHWRRAVDGQTNGWRSSGKCDCDRVRDSLHTYCQDCQ